MGTVFHPQQVAPKDSAHSRLPPSLDHHPSRANFTFLSKIASSGAQEEAVWWLAYDNLDPSQTYFVRQTSKVKVYNNKRVEAVLEEMRLLTQSNNQSIIKVFAAFHDCEYLYLVTQPLESVSFQELLEEYSFSEDQTRYVVSALLNVLDYVHSKGYALTELSPGNIRFDINTGQLKLMEMPNPTKIDSYCTSSAVSPVCPYSAPEVLYRGKILAECDFYSIGLLMYEMMTQEKVFQGKADRNSILRQNIEVQKSRIPEEWEHEAADFLIKILVKNPVLRLGRYGCFEVKNHPWLKEYDIEGTYKNRILLQGFKQSNRKDGNYDKVKLLEDDLSSKLVKDYLFQQAFEDFGYHRKEGEDLLSNCQQSFDKTSVLFNFSKIKLQDSYF